MGISRDTPLILRDSNNSIYLKKVGDIKVVWFYNTELGQDEGKIDYNVWSYKGWVKINNIIRYKTTKCIYKIMTSYGTICTDKRDIKYIYGNLPIIDKNYDIRNLNMSEKQLLHYIYEANEKRIKYDEIYEKNPGKAFLKIGNTDTYMYKLNVDCDYYHVGISHVNITNS